MGLYCTSCGKLLEKEEKFCTKCGAEVHADKSAHQPAKPKYFLRKKYILAAAMIIMIGIVFGCTGRGRLCFAKVCAMFDQYETAENVLFDSGNKTYEVYKQYYYFLDYASKLKDISDIETYDTTSYTVLWTANDSLEDDKVFLGEKEQRKYDTIKGIMDKRAETISTIDEIEDYLAVMVRLENQTQEFKEGKYFTPKKIDSKVTEWQSNLNCANSTYKNITDTDMPGYQEAYDCMKKIINEMRNSEYYESDSAYYPSFESVFVNHYNRGDGGYIAEMEINIKKIANEECTSKLKAAL